MSAELEALGRRAWRCKHWRWLPGMHGHYKILSGRIDTGVYVGRQHARDGGCMVFSGVEATEFWIRVTAASPDLSASATQGCMLTLIAERTGSMSDTLADIAHRMRRGATLPQALVEALESCP